MLKVTAFPLDLATAGASGSGFHGPLAVIVFVVFAVFAVGVMLFRRRRGGPGPQVNWVPKSMRRKVNEHYEEEGWQKPYDDDGNRNTDRDQI